MMRLIAAAVTAVLLTGWLAVRVVQLEAQVAAIEQEAAALQADNEHLRATATKSASRLEERIGLYQKEIDLWKAEAIKEGWRRVHAVNQLNRLAPPELAPPPREVD